jgi:hypothetical protein
MKHRKWARATGVVVLVPATLVALSASPGNASAPANFTATAISPTSTLTAAKSPTSSLAQTDPALLNRTDSAAVAVVVKLSQDGLATYTGGVAGFGATSPSVTGKDLSGSASEKEYDKHLTELDDAFAAQLAKKVPGATIGRRLHTVYGGVTTTVPANKVADVLSIPGVVAIQTDSLREPLTDSSPGFIGATSLYPGLGGAPNAGKGVIFGVLDTGAWPEHLSFADQGNLSAPPAKADGTPRACDFGDNPLTPANDPFVCNHKLIGGKPFLDTYLSNPARAAGERYKTARDSDGHGTHTGSTSAGNVVTSAKVLGVERGPIQGIAPGAWVSVYKVCGVQGCFSSDSAAAVEQAILDGVKVINFSISGGTSPFTDPVELAFLDAYAAGVFVSASGGNSGPTAGTVNHLSPWVTTVAASTQKREFDSTLTLTSGADTTVLHGASITAGVPASTPVVLSSAAPYGRARCDAPAAAGTFTGKIVACARGGNARVDKGYNVKAGGAVGMILYNPVLADVETDNHWLPTVHLADGTGFLAFVAAHPAGVSASFTAGTKINGTGDVMAAFSSRGPAGQFIKPDVTAPGVEILAGNTPTPESTTAGPTGEYYMAIAGTSMSSPHTAGSGLLLKALHPDWTPGQIKSALMTTATTSVVKEDLTTPADPFDMGAGRISLNVAGNPGLTFDESAAKLAALQATPLKAVDANLPSVNAPVLPGSLTTTRVAKNVTNKPQTYRASATAPAGSSITVSPSVFTVAAGKTAAFKITITSLTPTAEQQFGEVKLTPVGTGPPVLHLPVAFVPQQGDVKLTSDCAPASITLFTNSTCTVTATNASALDTTVNLRTDTGLRLPIVSAPGATVKNPFTATKDNVALNGNKLGVPSLAPGALFGYVPLASKGVAPRAIGDEELFNYTVPQFVYNGRSYTSIGVDSNGYLVAGGGSAADNECCILPPGASPNRPNDILAPFWTDLDGAGTPGVSVGKVINGAKSWIVVEWQVNVFATSDLQTFQVWLGMNGVQDVSFAYDPTKRPTSHGQPFLVVAENSAGQGGALSTVPTSDLTISSTPPVPAGSVSYTVKVLGLLPGTGNVTTSMTTPIVRGTTIVKSPVAATK